MATVNPNSSVVKALSAVESGERYPVMSLVRRNPEQAAVISKLIHSVVPPRHNTEGQREFTSPNVMEMRAISSRLGRDNADAESVLSMLPDMELSMQILVSSILSPKDMMSIELNFLAPEHMLPPELSSALLQLLRAHFDQVYKIEPELTKILRDMLFEKGSHVRAVIPENSLDEIINRNQPVSLEAISDVILPDGTIKGVGLLGAGLIESRQSSAKMQYGIALEDFKQFEFKTNHDSRVALTDQSGRISPELILEGVTVTDNPSILSYPALHEKIRQDRTRAALAKSNHLNASLESFKFTKLTDRELTSAIYKRAAKNHLPIQRLLTQEQAPRKTIGNPLVMELPSESVIPVIVPGQNTKHVGYFVILDSSGNPVKGKPNHNYYDELSSRMSTTGSSSAPSQLIQRVQAQTQGFDCSNNQHLDYSVKVYADMIEADLLARLRNGVYTNGVALARNQEIYRIMLARTLARQQTQLLFLPIELVTYFAFRYNADGIGKSLLTDMKLLNSLRATLMFSNVMQSVRNSIGLTNVNFKLDQDDPDPQKTIERMMSEVVRARQQAFPLNTSSPADIVYQLQRAGYQFTYEGHPGLPDVKVELTERNTNYAMPSPEIEENLRKRAIMATGLNPETVDSAFNGEFATSILANNVLLSRRVMQMQEQFCPQLKDHLGKVILSSEGLLNDMRETISRDYDKLELDKEILKQLPGEGEVKKAAMIDYILNQFVSGMEVELPRPTTVTNQNQLKALQEYIELLDVALDGWFNQKFFNANMTGSVSEAAETLREVVRAYFIRKWMADNGVLTELSEITARDNENNLRTDFADIQKSHLEALMTMATTLVQGLEPLKKATDEALKKAGFNGSDTGSTDFGTTDNFDANPTPDNTDNATGDDTSTSGEGDTAGDETQPDDTKKPTDDNPPDDQTDLDSNPPA